MFRRGFIKILASGLLYALLGIETHARSSNCRYAFLHGVASGDPLVDGVILWTRVSGARGENVTVNWQIATDAGMQSVLRSGQAATDADRDYTVKIDVRGLPADSRLFYRFVADGTESPVGATRTLPTGRVDLARFAVVSCSSFPTGYFHAYREVADRNDLNAVVHLGDYIYEYGMGQYATGNAEALGRVPDPPTELLTLDDYRRRHAQYRTDANLQAMHAAHPIIAVWDDHEVANDAWADGSDNHNDDENVDEGSWRQRGDVAVQAYFEWLPIRGKPNGGRTRIFRDFQFGDLLSLAMIDTRFYGRERQPDISGTDGTRGSIEAVLNHGKRHMLGRRQERWLRKHLQTAASTWQVIAQQVLMSPMHSPDLEPLLDLDRPAEAPRELLEQNIELSKSNPPLLFDTWDGYPWARQRLLHDIGRYGSNTVVLSGDLHTSVAGDLRLDGEKDVVAVEFMTPSVTSPGFAEYLPERHPGAVRDATLELNPNLRYLETERRGWLCLTVTHGECIGEWHLLDGITSRSYTSIVDRRLAVAAGKVAAGLYEA